MFIYMTTIVVTMLAGLSSPSSFASRAKTDRNTKGNIARLATVYTVLILGLVIGLLVYYFSLRFLLLRKASDRSLPVKGHSRLSRIIRKTVLTVLCATAITMIHCRYLASSASIFIIRMIRYR